MLVERRVTVVANILEFILMMYSRTDSYLDSLPICQAVLIVADLQVEYHFTLFSTCLFA